MITNDFDSCDDDELKARLSIFDGKIDVPIKFVDGEDLSINYR